VINSYSSLEQLTSAVNNMTVASLREVARDFGIVPRNRKRGVTLELEGTNSEGDFGFGVGLSFQHRDLARRSTLLTALLCLALYRALVTWGVGKWEAL